MALQDQIPAPAGSCPEQPSVEKREGEVRRSMKRAGFALAGIAASAAVLWMLNRQR
jgi:hypothetical protein